MKAWPWAILLPGVALEALILLGLSLHPAGADNLGSERTADIFVAILAVAGGVYLLAVAVVLQRALPRAATLWVLAVAVVLRLSVIFAPPFLSSDVYRYVWDGRVQVASINPYRYIPDDPALASLRDPAIYPHVNRHEYAPTIYPPAAQAIFFLVARISQSVTAMKCAMAALELLAMAAVILLLRRAGIPEARVLIYAWNPLAVWAIAGNGHIDGAVIGLVALALLARGFRWDGWTGAALGAAIATKFLPAAIAPGLWRRGDWRMPLACVAVIAGLYACYLGVGWRVLGYLPGYSGEEGLTQGSGIWLLAALGQFAPLPDWAPLAYFALAAASLLALAAAIALPRRPTETASEEIPRVARDVAVLAAATVVLLSPHYPWYFVWLAIPCCLAPIRSIIFLSVAPLLLYRDPFNERFFWPALIYMPAILLALRDLLNRAPAPLLRGDADVHDSLA